MYFRDASYNGWPISCCRPQQIRLSSWGVFLSLQSAYSSFLFFSSFDFKSGVDSFSLALVGVLLSAGWGCWRCSWPVAGRTERLYHRLINLTSYCAFQWQNIATGIHKLWNDGRNAASHQRQSLCRFITAYPLKLKNWWKSQLLNSKSNLWQIYWKRLHWLVNFEEVFNF